MAIGVGGEPKSAGFEDGVDLVVGVEKSLRLPGRLEPPHDFLSFSGWPVTAFDSVVEALVGAVVGVRAGAASVGRVGCRRSSFRPR